MKKRIILLVTCLALTFLAGCGDTPVQEELTPPSSTVVTEEQSSTSQQDSDAPTQKSVLEDIPYEDSKGKTADSAEEVAPAEPSTPTEPAAPAEPAAPTEPAAPVESPQEDAQPAVKPDPPVEKTEEPPAEKEPEPSAPPSGSPSQRMVWIPVNGGKKYHTHAGCSNMIDPVQVTVETAQARGFTFCKRCYQ